MNKHARLQHCMSNKYADVNKSMFISIIYTAKLINYIPRYVSCLRHLKMGFLLPERKLSPRKLESINKRYKNHQLSNDE